MFIGFKDADKEAKPPSRAMRVLRMIVSFVAFPFVAVSWTSNPETVSEYEQAPEPHDPNVPKGWRLAAETVLRRRRLRVVLVLWGGVSLLLVGFGAYGVSGVDDSASAPGSAINLGIGLALLFALALPAARKLRPARRSAHLGLVPERLGVPRGEQLAFALWPSELARKLDRVEVGLVCRRQWTSFELSRSAIWIIRDKCVWQRWQRVALDWEPPQQLTLEVPGGGKVSREDDEAAVYWLLSARICGRPLRRERSDVPIWVLVS